MSAKLTHHAEERASQRLGLAPRAARKMADKALQHGIGVALCSGPLQSYLASLENKPLIYGQHIFIFGEEDVLVTVLHLPRQHRNQARKIRSRMDLQS